jgi:hypothetical protein
MLYRRVIYSVTIIALTCLALRGQSTISAEELARHLGVVSWRVPKAQLPPSVKVEIAVVEKGKVAEIVLSSSFRSRSDLVVCASVKEGRPFISCSAGGSVSSRHMFHSWNQFLGRILPLPEDIPPGVYILSGKPTDPEHRLRSTDRIDVVETGLAIAIAID